MEAIKNFFNPLSIEQCCKNGNLTRLKYLVKKYTKHNTHSINSHELIQACKHNHLHIVKYFVSELNISKYLINLPRIIDECNNLEIIKYLVENGVNISFISVSFPKSYDIVKYLLCLEVPCSKFFDYLKIEISEEINEIFEEYIGKDIAGLIFEYSMVNHLDNVPTSIRSNFYTDI